MNELIKISENNGNKVVSARELHAFLEVETRFGDWIARRIDEYDFTENEDFEVLLKNEKNPQGGRPAVEYAISLDMAKELAMVEKNDKGKQARRYFIAIEKKATQPQATPLMDKQTQHLTLLALMKKHLRKGDMKEIAQENGFTYDAVRNIFYASSKRPEVIEAIFRKALQNKKQSVNLSEMIHQLQN